MLNPEYINRNNIYIAKKTKNHGKISLSKANNQGIENDAGYKAVNDALHIKNSLVIKINAIKLLVVEGIYDYFAIKKLLKDQLKENNLEILCLNGATKENMHPNVSFIHGLGVPWVAIFDNDEQGHNGYTLLRNKMSNLPTDTPYNVGSKNNITKRIETNNLHVLNTSVDKFSTNEKDFEMHHLFSIEDRKKINTKYNSSSVKNALVDLFYDKDFNEFDKDTKDNFNKLFNIILEKLEKQN